MELFFLQAECGDAAQLTYTGNDGQLHHIFVDSGFDRTYGHVLEERINSVEKIDLFVVSHIHDDHIGGAIAYTRAITRGEVMDKVLRWCYNPPRPKATVTPITGAISSAASIDQGDELVAYLTRTQQLPAVDVANTLAPLDLHGLQLTWLSPSPRKLNRLRRKYVDPTISLEKEEDASVSMVAGASGNDYYLKVEDFDLRQFSSDNNIENGSSIAFLSELDGFRVLWLADAHPKLLAQSLKDLGYTPQNRLKCNYVKVTHHASKGNNSDGLYDLIDCRHYVFSADGTNKHYLPNKECLTRILRNGQRDVKADRYHFYFTYDNPVLCSIFNVDRPEVFDDWNFQCHFMPTGKKWLQLPETPVQ